MAALPTTSNINEPDLDLQDPHTDNINRLIMYIKVINKSKWDDYDDWFKLGAIIHNEHAPFSLFDEMSQLSTKYDKQACIQKWNEYSDPFSTTRNLTIATVIAMAKVDNPSEFLNCNAHDIEMIQRKIMQHGITDDKAARLYYHLYPNQHIYDQSTGVWYYANEYNMWNVDTNSSHMANGIKSKVRKQLETLCNRVDVTDKLHGHHRKMLINAIRVLETRNNTIYVARATAGYYRVDTTNELFESSNHLFAFKNGVYDLKTKTFRLPRPEEYVLVNCNYDYKPMTPEMLQVKERILAIAKSIVKVEDVTQLLQTIALSLSGDCDLEHLHVWKGQGSNGKSLLLDLIKCTFGPYCDTMDVSYLLVNNTRSANTSNSMMAKKRYCRIIFSTEPPPNIKMKASMLKMFSSKNQVTCTDRYGTTSFVPKFRLFIQTNFELNLDTNDNDIKANLKVQEFPWEFVDHPTKPHEKLIDPNLKAEIRNNPLFHITFFHVLLEYYYMKPN
ncbi:D5 DNA Primase [uncultured virus]|nr:D5 DNA Primase [uncultured virus]